MKRLRLRGPSDFRDRLADVLRIVQFVASKRYEVSTLDAYHAWRSYSEDYWCAGWVTVDEENLEEFFSQRNRYFEVEEPT